MTTDDPRRHDSPFSSTHLGNRLPHALEFGARLLGYGAAFVVYSAILIVAIGTLGLIEIRQANLENSNALIAMLEQRDRYGDGYFHQAVSALVAETNRYDEGLRRLVGHCPLQASAVENADHSGAASADAQPAAAGDGAAPQNCAQLQALVDRHLIGLYALQDDLRLKQANLPKYYDAYIDGLREKTPQLVPLLRYMDAQDQVLTVWTRLPLELHEMVLLICMGALGAVISVTRCFVDASVPDPTARDLCYRPVAGAVIALGIYVLFRAAQLFFGGGGQDSTMVSTSVFVLAALGLASGFSAREAVIQIQRMTLRLLRGAESGRDGGGTAGPPAIAAERSPETAGGVVPAATG
jgi:hypothetical protein